MKFLMTICAVLWCIWTWRYIVRGWKSSTSNKFGISRRRKSVMQCRSIWGKENIEREATYLSYYRPGKETRIKPSNLNVKSEMYCFFGSEWHAHMLDIINLFKFRLCGMFYATWYVIIHLPHFEVLKNPNISKLFYSVLFMYVLRIHKLTSSLFIRFE